MDMLTAVAAVIGPIMGLVAAVASVASLWNAYQFSVLKGRIDEVSQNLTAHLSAPGLHR